MTADQDGELDVEAFTQFFTEVHEVEPFDWQCRLAEQVLTIGEWPEAIDVPTGMGKTAVLDVAVFALAAEAHRPGHQRRAPTRTFMIVDRRVIVDQAYERATRLAGRLVAAGDGDPSRPATAMVARRLADLAAGPSARLSVKPRPAVPLMVVRMRGGTRWSSAWLSSPAQPAVVCGTVDQLGSRLLFRGYGVGEHRRPIDAALVGTDRLIILDEAHLSRPLAETIDGVDDEETLAINKILEHRRPRPVLMSATLPRQRQPRQGVLALDPAAETSDAARARLSAVRLARLVDIRSKDLSELAAVLTGAAREALARDGVSRVLVTVNTVGLARRVFDLLRSDADGGRLERALVTGRCRGVEREPIAKEWLLPGGRLSADTSRPAAMAEGTRPVVVVATQTVEVGADLDVDALVSECAPLDALLQRLGRLNRRGEMPVPAEAVVVHQAARHDPEGSEQSAVRSYGEATVRTWRWLTERAGVPEPTSAAKIGAALASAPSLDLGPASLPQLLSAEERAALATEPPLCPVLLGTHLAAWARTSPAPVPDQEIGPFLHGVDRGGPRVDIGWRALDSDRSEDWERELENAPIGAHELVSVPLGEAHRWLMGKTVIGGADLEDEPDDADLDPFEERDVVVAWTVLPDGGVERVGPRGLRPGASIVVSSSAGGYDRWGWTGKHRDTVVADVADLPPEDSPPRRGGVHRLRCRAEILRSVLPGAAIPPFPADSDDTEEIGKWLKDLARTASQAGDASGFSEDDGSSEDGMSPGRELSEVDGSGPMDPGPESPTAAEEGTWTAVLAARLNRLLDSLEQQQRQDRRLVPVGGTDERPRWYVILGKRTAGDLDDAEGEDDPNDAGTSAALRPVGLDVHLRDVEGEARRLAAGLGLSDDLCRTVALAGLAHDLGKADPRFQAMLHGGSRLRVEAADELVAKSEMDPSDRARYRLAARLAGWPSGMRHEAISGAILELILRDHREEAAGLDTDLLRHLVASHHGRARPLLPGMADPQPQPVRVRLPGTDEEVTVKSDELLVDWDAPGRFERLGGRYGWWGLALLETILRLADQDVSARYGILDEDDDDESSAGAPEPLAVGERA